MKTKRLHLCIFGLMFAGNALLLQRYLFYRSAHAQAAFVLSAISSQADAGRPEASVQALQQRLRSLEFVEHGLRQRWPEFHRILAATLHYAQVYDLDPYLLLSLIHHESGFRTQAISPRGACGLMQVNYAVWKGPLHLDFRRIFEVEYNIAVGCRILRHYLDQAGGDVARALYLYNNGPNENGNVRYPRLVMQGKFAAKPSGRG